MLRGGLAGLGGRGGVGGLDPVAAPPVDWFGLWAKDQGGAFAAASTRVHVWGLHSLSGTAGATLGYSPMGINQLQGVGVGQMLYVIPHFFPRAGRITRLVSRTNGGGAGGNPRMKIGIWDNGTLGGASAVAAVLGGSAFPGNRLAQSSDFDVWSGAANRQFSSTIDVVHEAGVYLWAGLVVNNQAVTNNHTIPGLRRNALYPIHGITMDATTPQTISSDGGTFSVGFRHAHAYTLTEDLPSPFPQTAPALLDGGAAIDSINVPAIGFCWQPL